MDLFVGTSSFSDPQWAGRFYPLGLPASERLRFYAERLAAVEINNTFYRLPSPRILERWVGQVPAGFRFALKAPGRITHRGPLDAGSSALAAFVDALSALGPHLGPVLFQLPPTQAADVGALDRFLEALPLGLQVAFEFRHRSWRDAQVLRSLARRGAALCAADMNGPPAEVMATAHFGYLRLRRGTYGPAELGRWAAVVRAQPWSAAYVFFKHEGEASGPRLARELALASAQETAPSAPAG